LAKQHAAILWTTTKTASSTLLTTDAQMPRTILKNGQIPMATGSVTMKKTTLAPTSICPTPIQMG
jgi:hypothetical protein